MKRFSLFICALLTFASCADDDTPLPIPTTMEITEQLKSDYTLLPEEEISISNDGRIFATYTNPTEIYVHGVLGDVIEAAQLVVVVDGEFFEFPLSSEYVFEDLRPRLYDVDNDGELEFITIRTHVDLGGAVVIYKLVDDELVEYSAVPEIGTTKRWVNPVSINDLDNDGVVEIAWIETPHIGGTLKVAKVVEGLMQPAAETSLYSNHRNGDRNMCLSVLTENDGKKVFYVPTQNRDKIVGFTFENNSLNIFEEINQVVDFTETLVSQYDFENIIEEEDNCIIVE